MEIKWQEAYLELLRQYSRQQSEAILYEASKLSKALVERGVGPEDLVQFHLEALEGLFRDISPLRVPGLILMSFDLLLEVMMAYALSFREYLEVKDKLIARLETFNQELTAANSNLETKVQELTVIQDMTRELGACLDLELTARIITRHLRELFHCTGGLYLVNGSGEWQGYTLEETLVHSAPPGDLAAGARQSARLAGRDLTLPLVIGQEVGGAVFLQKEGGFSADEVRLAEIIAGYAALAVERAQLYEAMKRQATIDAKTGLYNYQHMMELLEKELARARRYQRTFTLAMLDIDDFKVYNDTHGHRQGDKTLQRIAAIIQSSIREVDIAARYGGEEFVMIMPETNTLEATAVTERVRRNIMNAAIDNEGCGPGRVLTVSIGLATYPLDAATIGELIDAADSALYMAKAQGKNTVRVFGKADRWRSDKERVF
ncbi:diguanylate cyclase [Moorella naiadis]|uniref:diguanylate cyclase n=1 Tax=Moorella naiadis (nom. illeg.) TaxID=3093670 RepID=UPI003D9CB920